MLERLKRKLEEKKAGKKAVAESRQWKTNPLLQGCLQAMRGSCTVAPMEMHEAAIAVVNIALREDTWTEPLERNGIPEDLFPGMVYIVWDEATLPVLKAPWTLAAGNLQAVTAVAKQTFLVGETMDRILWFDARNRLKLYSIA